MIILNVYRFNKYIHQIIIRIVMSQLTLRNPVLLLNLVSRNSIVLQSTKHRLFFSWWTRTTVTTAVTFVETAVTFVMIAVTFVMIAVTFVMIAVTFMMIAVTVTSTKTTTTNFRMIVFSEYWFNSLYHFYLFLVFLGSCTIRPTTCWSWSFIQQFLSCGWFWLHFWI